MSKFNEGLSVEIHDNLFTSQTLDASTSESLAISENYATSETPLDPTVDPGPTVDPDPTVDPSGNSNKKFDLWDWINGNKIITGAAIAAVLVVLIIVIVICCKHIRKKIEEDIGENLDYVAHYKLQEDSEELTQINVDQDEDSEKLKQTNVDKKHKEIKDRSIMAKGIQKMNGYISSRKPIQIEDDHKSNGTFNPEKHIRLMMDILSKDLNKFNKLNIQGFKPLYQELYANINRTWEPNNKKDRELMRKLQECIKQKRQMDVSNITVPVAQQFMLDLLNSEEDFGENMRGKFSNKDYYHSMEEIPKDNPPLLSSQGPKKN